eukprot:COSAG05_NODE_6855_length_892_cov_1.296343_1_plen_103_part_00
MNARVVLQVSGSQLAVALAFLLAMGLIMLRSKVPVHHNTPQHSTTAPPHHARLMCSTFIRIARGFVLFAGKYQSCMVGNMRELIECAGFVLFGKLKGADDVP